MCFITSQKKMLKENKAAFFSLLEKKKEKFHNTCATTAILKMASHLNKKTRLTSWADRYNPRGEMSP